MAVSNRTIGLNVAGLLLVKAASMVISLATIPALLAYFHYDKEILGIWLAFFTFMAIALSLDLGIGNRLKNDILAKISEKLDFSDLIKESFQAQILVSIFIALLAAFGGIIVWATNYTNNETGQIINKYPELVLVAVVFILLSMPLRLSYFILQAQQKNAASALIALLPQAVVLIYAITASKANSLPSTLLALAIIFSLSTVIIYWASFTLGNRYKHHPTSIGIAKTHSKVFSEEFISKLRPGLPFFLIQVSIIFLYSSNELFYLISGTTTDIVLYQYYFRPFSLFSVGLSIISLPFWSAIRLSHLDNNFKRTQQLFTAIIFLIIPVAIALLPTVYFYQYFLNAWLGEGVHLASTTMLVLFAISTLLICIMHALSSILSGFDLIAFQAKVLGMALFIKLLGFALLTPIDGYLDPVMLSTIFGLLFVAIAYAFRAIKLWRINLIEQSLVS